MMPSQCKNSLFPQLCCITIIVTLHACCYLTSIFHNSQMKQTVEILYRSQFTCHITIHLFHDVFSVFSRIITMPGHKVVLGHPIEDTLPPPPSTQVTTSYTDYGLILPVLINWVSCNFPFPSIGYYFNYNYSYFPLCISSIPTSPYLEIKMISEIGILVRLSQFTYLETQSTVFNCSHFEPVNFPQRNACLVYHEVEWFILYIEAIECTPALQSDDDGSTSHTRVSLRIVQILVLYYRSSNNIFISFLHIAGSY